MHVETFKVGDKAVYPAHGVGKVTGIETQQIAGSKERFYIIEILENGMKIMVPTHKVNDVGLRNVISRKQAERVYQILKKREASSDNQTWNRRYREYMEKIKTGSVYEVAEVLRDLYLLKFDKELSFGERKMLDMAKSLLIKELAIAKRKKEEDIQSELDKIFSCC